MGQEPQELRQDIEHTRSQMGRTLDEIEDRVSPGRIVQRRTDRVRGRVQDVRERVMGIPDDISTSMSDAEGRSPVQQASDGLSSAVSTVGDTVQQAPHAVTRRTQGNPLAAGLVAFGAGLLAGSLLPRTEQEQQAASAAKEALQPVADELASAGQELTGDLKEEAQHAVEATKETAAEAVDHVKEEAQESAQRVQAEGKERAIDVSEEVSRSQ